MLNWVRIKPGHYLSDTRCYEIQRVSSGLWQATEYDRDNRIIWSRSFCTLKQAKEAVLLRWNKHSPLKKQGWQLLPKDEWTHPDMPGPFTFAAAVFLQGESERENR